MVCVSRNAIVEFSDRRQRCQIRAISEICAAVRRLACEPWLKLFDSNLLLCHMAKIRIGRAVNLQAVGELKKISTSWRVGRLKAFAGIEILQIRKVLFERSKYHSATRYDNIDLFSAEEAKLDRGIEIVSVEWPGGKIEFAEIFPV